MKIINSKGPSIDPWRALVEIKHDSQATPFTYTCYLSKTETNYIRIAVIHNTNILLNYVDIFFECRCISQNTRDEFQSSIT